ncbi:MAG: TM2 domain-containing protein [Methyloprofundus sp.]|nr:TM2 domain-containing protein [Methyloprofundus sp.]
MIGKIKSYDEKTQTGVIELDEQFYGFHLDDWSESVAPRIESSVLFEAEGDTATMVTLIGNYAPTPKEAVKSRRIAIALAIFPLTAIVGGHRWYLGFYKMAMIQTVVTAMSFGGGYLWPFIEGVLIFMGKMYEDSEGRPLK